MAITEIARKEIRKLEACAIKPITGGPIKNPKKPSEETAVMAVPGDNVLDLPAALYTSGTTEETPSPIKKKPMSDGIS